MANHALRLDMSRQRRTGALGGGITYSAEAQQFFGRVADPGATRKGLYATMIDALVTGGVWTKLDVLYILAAADAATALTNLVQSSYGATSVNAPAFAVDQGYTGGATKALNTGFNPTTASTPKFTLDSATLFAWGLTQAGVATPIIAQGDAGTCYLYGRYVDDNQYTRINTTAQITVASTDGRGLWLGVRRSAADHRVFKNGAELGNNAGGSTVLSNSDVTILAGATQFGAISAAAAGVGGKLTDGEIAALYNALHTYLQAVAGVS